MRRLFFIFMASLLISMPGFHVFAKCISGNCSAGKGTYVFDNGEKYIGEFKNGKRHGQGRHTFSTGDVYVGEFKDDKRNGHGTYNFISGGVYVGQFKNDMRNGRGT